MHFYFTDFAMPKISTKKTRETQARENVPRVKKTAKSRAERNREYRARKKALKTALNQHPIAGGSSTDIICIKH